MVFIISQHVNEALLKGYSGNEDMLKAWFLILAHHSVLKWGIIQDGYVTYICLQGESRALGCSKSLPP